MSEEHYRYAPCPHVGVNSECLNRQPGCKYQSIIHHELVGVTDISCTFPIEVSEHDPAHHGIPISTSPRIIKCYECEFAHIDPLPPEESLSKFYKEEYYGLVKNGSVAPEIKKVSEKDQEELRWLKSTFWTDMDYYLMKFSGGKRTTLFDAGAGTGDFVTHMQSLGWTCAGTEPGYRGENPVIRGQFIEEIEEENAYDVVTLINVLEHVRDPFAILKKVHRLLKPHGILAVRVPNDFTAWQRYAEPASRSIHWWVSVPDHLNYFNMRTISNTILRSGFTPLLTTTDFPMEMFIMMGMDYPSDKKVGKGCHEMRKSFEKNVGNKGRRYFYEALAARGIGRTAVVFARRNE